LIQDKEIVDLKVACYNINGLRNTNSYKLEGLLDWAIEEDIGIIGMAETNMKSKEGNYMLKDNRDFIGFWA
ncbi:14437_t:CDS:1, partial [Dentiscutata heterogama]